MSEGLILRSASVDEILELRTRVLIAGTTRGSPAFDGDDAPTTRHFGAFDGPRIVACASCMRAADGSWQLRGMATEEQSRSRGIGSRLLGLIEEELLVDDAAARLWCNARVRAAAFYERAGWKVVGPVFEIEGVGPHVEMVCGRNR